MEIIKKSLYSKNYIVTIAIGDEYVKNFKKFSLPTWIKYCKKNDLGIIIFTKPLIADNSDQWKKATWQKLLIGDQIKEKKNEV